jgi:hypothetical protein
LCYWATGREYIEFTNVKYFRILRSRDRAAS